MISIGYGWCIISISIHKCIIVNILNDSGKLKPDTKCIVLRINDTHDSVNQYANIIPINRVLVNIIPQQSWNLFGKLARGLHGISVHVLNAGLGGFPRSAGGKKHPKLHDSVRTFHSGRRAALADRRAVLSLSKIWTGSGIVGEWLGMGGPRPILDCQHKERE